MYIRLTRAADPPAGVLRGTARKKSVVQARSEMGGSQDLAPNDAPRVSQPSELHDLVVEHSTAIYRVALSIVRDPALAEDVTQDTLLKAWQALPTFRGESSLKSWILRIAHNNAISTLRRRRDVLREPAEMPETMTAESVETRVQQRAALRDFEEALDRLDDLSRSVVVMREVEQMTYEEIAEALGVSLPTVKTRLLRARRTLAAALGEWKP